MADRLSPTVCFSLLIATLLLCACASTDPAPQPGAGTPPVSSGPDPQQQPPSAGSGITAGQRASSAVEGLVMGAVIGAQAGPIGAAVGAGALLVYSAITGHVPFSGPGGGEIIMENSFIIRGSSSACHVCRDSMVPLTLQDRGRLGNEKMSSLP